MGRRVDGAIGSRGVTVVGLGFALTLALALAGCTTPITVIGEDEGGSSTGDTDTSTTSITSSTVGQTSATPPTATTTVDPDSGSDNGSDTVSDTDAPLCEPSCPPGECCVAGLCFNAPEPVCNPGCAPTEVCQCPQGTNPCDCTPECVLCGVEQPSYTSCLEIECPAGEVCIVDDPGAPTFGWCAAQGCGNDDCACPLPPGGSAPNHCADLPGDGGNGSCFLDCSSGGCPEGMVCRPVGARNACVWPGEGFETDCCVANGTPGCDDPTCETAICNVDPFCCSTEWDQICADQAPDACPEQCGAPPPPPMPPAYGDCSDNPLSTCQPGEDACLTDGGGMPSGGACSQSGCITSMECPTAPPTGTAVVSCDDLGNGNTCYLDCSMGEACPDGMACTNVGMGMSSGMACLWPDDGFVLDEDFELGALRPGWTVIDVDGLTPDAAVSYITDAFVVTDQLEAGMNLGAYSTSWYNPAGQADDWLVTPQVTLGPGSTLWWEARAGDPTLPDGYEVRISTTGPTVMGLLANPPLFSIADEADTFTLRSVDLAAAGYANQDVHIAWHNDSNDDFILIVDDVQVTE